MNKVVVETDKGQKVSKVEIVNGNVEIVYQRDLPESVKDIHKRNWYIDNDGDIQNIPDDTLNNFSTKERAEAVLALGQLLELADYVGCKKFHFSFLFALKDKSLSDAFREKYADLFKKAEKLL